VRCDSEVQGSRARVGPVKGFLKLGCSRPTRPFLGAGGESSSLLLLKPSSLTSSTPQLCFGVEEVETEEAVALVLATLVTCTAWLVFSIALYVAPLPEDRAFFTGTEATALLEDAIQA